MSLEERSKYRRLLADNNSQSSTGTNTKSQAAPVSAETSVPSA